MPIDFTEWQEQNTQMAEPVQPESKITFDRWKQENEPIGLVGAIIKKPEEKIPFAGGIIKTGRDLNLLESVKKLQRGDESYLEEYTREYDRIKSLRPKLTPKDIVAKLPSWEQMKQADIDEVTKYFENMAETQRRGYTLGGRVGQILSEMPAFMIEFLATGGLQQLGSKTAREAGEKVLGQYAKKGIGKAVVGTAAFATGAGFRAAGMPQRAAEAVVKRQLPKGIDIDEQGDIQTTGPDESKFTSLWKGLVDHYIEVASEQAGEYMAPVISKVTGKLPLIGKFTGMLEQAWLKKFPGKTSVEFGKKILSKAGFHGVLSEMGEEDIGWITRAIFNIEDYGAGPNATIGERLAAGLRQDIENIPAELISFSIPGIGGSAINALGSSRTQVEQRTDIIPEQKEQALKYIGDIETIVEKEIISKFPDRIDSQESLERVGNQIAKELGVAGITWHWDTTKKAGAAFYRPSKKSITLNPNHDIFRDDKAWFKIRRSGAFEGQWKDIINKTPGDLNQDYIKRAIIHELGHQAIPRTGQQAHRKEFFDWVNKNVQNLFEQTEEKVVPVERPEAIGPVQEMIGPQPAEPTVTARKPIVDENAIFAIKLKTGKMVSDPDAVSHSDLLIRKKINPTNIDTAGWLNPDKTYISEDQLRKPELRREQPISAEPTVEQKPEHFISEEIKDKETGLKKIQAKISDKPNSQVIGSVQYNYDAKTNTIHLSDTEELFVDKKYRRQGIATDLINKIKQIYPDAEIDWGPTTEEGLAFLYGYEKQQIKPEQPEKITKSSDFVKIGLQGLAAEAKKYPTFEEFEKAWLLEIKHGTYWHITYDPEFHILPEKGPRDMSSMAAGGMDKGKLMLTSHLEYWAESYMDVEETGGKPRGYAALIDMSNVSKEDYYQVNRGFGNEFYVKDPSKAKVIATIPIKRALKYDEALQKVVPDSSAELREFYEANKKHPAETKQQRKPYQSQYIAGHEIPKVLDMTEAERRKFMKKTTGKKSMKDMTPSLAQEYIDALHNLAREKGIETGKLPSERKFRKPVSPVTPQIYQAKILGVDFMLEPAMFGKMRLDLEFAKEAKKIDQLKQIINRLGGETVATKTAARIKNKPTKSIARFAELLNTFEEAPANLTSDERAVFNYFRNLNRTILTRENEVREKLGLKPIPYKTGYMRHIIDVLVQDIVEGRHPLPEELKYWAVEHATKKIHNPMEFERKLGDELEDMFSQDIIKATKAMLWTGLKEIHLDEPLKFFEQQLGLHSEVIPAPTRKWAENFINHMIVGQQTNTDARLNELVKESGFGSLLNKVLRPFGRKISYKPLSNVMMKAGRWQIYGVMGWRPKQLIRNKFQILQNLALYKSSSIIKSYYEKSDLLDKLMSESLFLQTYKGFEDLNEIDKGTIGRMWLAPFQWTAVTNASRAMKVSFWDTLELITDKKYKGLGWADPQRTYDEEEGFIYDSEKKILLDEMEFGAGVTQYHYIPMAMPGVFKHKTAIPFTRLQSWWMNYFFKFHREAAHRFFAGETRDGRKLPWSRRLGWGRYLTIGGVVLNTLGYSSSYLFGAAPDALPPFGQILVNLVRLIGADDDRARKSALRKMWTALKTFIPGYLAYKDFVAIWNSGGDLSKLFFYNKGVFKKEKVVGPPQRSGASARGPSEPARRQ